MLFYFVSFSNIFISLYYRQDLLDDSYYAGSQGSVPSIQGAASESTKDKQRYDVYARDSNNKNLKIRHVSSLSLHWPNMFFGF